MKTKIPSPSESNQLFSRRTLLRSLLASTAMLNSACWASATSSETVSQSAFKRLVLIELAGGNDGLSTVVPFSQKQYYKARPVLALPEDQLLKLDEHLGLHPQLEPLMSAWQAHDMHIALGVGYPDPNRSHFRSIDIWNTASGNDKVLHQGWLANAFDDASTVAEGIVFGGDYGPLLGSTRSLVLEKPKTFAKQAKRMRGITLETSNRALAHVVSVRQQIVRVLDELQGMIAAREETRSDVAGSSLNQQLHTISDIIAYGTKIPVLKATLKGFDTHYHQPNRHQGLMRDLADSLSGFRQRLMDTDDWNDTLIMTYSEFGRRPAENGSRGTDHGTSAPVILMGGRVQGGFSGEQPVFPVAAEKDMDFSVDYRQLYRTVAENWLNIRPRSVSLNGYTKLNILR